MSIRAAELVKQAAERLRGEFNVSAGLQDVVRKIESANDPALAAEVARLLLGERIEAVEDAHSELEDLSKSLAHLRTILPYTEEGWPREREQLERLLRDEPVGGVVAWLDHWYDAAGTYRMNVLDWLGQELRLPDGAELLAERGELAARALSEFDWALAEPMLSAGAAGLRLGDAEVPVSDAARGSLQLLLARLALMAGQLQAAEELLQAAESRESSAAVLAL